MKIETQPLEDHQVKITVEPDLELFELSKKNAARRLSKRSKIPGFRPGKAPYPIVVRHVGETTVIQEAIELLIKDIYPKVIEEADIEPYGPGILDKIVSTDPPIFEFILPLKASVELGDYSSIRFPYELTEISDEEVEAMITNLRERHSVDEPVDRPAQEGDILSIRLSGERMQASEDENATFIEERSFPFRIGTEDIDNDSKKEWPYTGFSRQLIGLSEGDRKTLVHTFSESTLFESLQGIEVQFLIDVEEVKSSTLPALDDEFAQSVGDYADLNDFMSTLRLDLQNEAHRKYHEEYDENILNEVIKISTIKYPPPMLEHEIIHIIENLENRLTERDIDIDLYLKTRSMDMDALQEEAKPFAEKRLQNILVLLELSEAEKIQVDPDELQDAAQRTVETIYQNLPEKDARKISEEDMFSSLLGNFMLDKLTERTQDRMRDIARGLVSPDDTTTPIAETDVRNGAIRSDDSIDQDDVEGENNEITPEPNNESHVDDDTALKSE